MILNPSGQLTEQPECPIPAHQPSKLTSYLLIPCFPQPPSAPSLPRDTTSPAHSPSSAAPYPAPPTYPHPQSSVPNPWRESRSPLHPAPHLRPDSPPASAAFPDSPTQS